MARNPSHWRSANSPCKVLQNQGDFGQMGAKLVVTPTIVFDLDGTLADTARDLVSTLNVILAREGIPPVGMEQARALIGAGARPLIQRGLQVHGRSVTAARLEALYQQFLTYYHEHIADETVLFPGVLKALERISEGRLAAGGMHQQAREPCPAAA